ncbi:hypothetical protein [Methanobrevibacter sp.]|uniref:hypothetical protein n=1 Tax=Methanobrevibacter sp. TaxID=66852 RepID=UPI0038671E58
MLILMLIFLIIPVSFAADVDSNSTMQASDVFIDDSGIDDINENILSVEESDKISAGYDYESVPNETVINYELGTNYTISLTNSFSCDFTYDEYVYAYINGNNTPIKIKTPSGFEVYANNKNPPININSFSTYLNVGENTVVFHPTDSSLSYHNLVNNHYVPIKIIASEPKDPATVYYVDSSVSINGNGIEGSTYKTLAAAITAANSNFGEKGGSIIIKKGKNGIYSESSTMSISKNMEIRAEDGADVTITSTYYDSLFSQTTKSNVTIKGLTFKDMELYYGAIYYQNGNAVDGSVLNILNCSFINNEVPTLVRLVKTQATIKQVNFISNTITSTGINGGLVNYNDGGGSRWVPSPYKFDVSFCNIIGNENGDYVFTGSAWQSLTADNNYWGSNYVSKPTGIYNRENTNYGDGDSLLTLNNWVFLNIAMSNGEISAGTSYPITFDFKQNDGSALEDNMAVLDVSLSATGIVTPSNLTISNNHAQTTYIAPKMARDTITVKSDSTVLYTKNIANIVCDYKYMSTPTVDAVDYLIGENKNITIGIISDVTFGSSEKLYAYVGETEIDIGVSANDNVITIDLKTISDKFNFVVGQDYTFYFHPKISTLTGKGIKTGEYFFNPLTVSVTGEYNPEPQVVYTSTPKVGDKTNVDYSDDLVVSVNIVYDESSLSQSKLNTLNSGKMMMFVNGGKTGIAVDGVNSGSKSFTVNLVDYKDELVEGKNTISFHPATSLLESVFGTHDILTLNNLTVNVIVPEPPYVSTPSPSYVTYTKTTSCKVTVTVTGSAVSDFDGSNMYMYIDGATSGVRLDGVSSDATRFTVDLADYDSYFTAGKTYSVIFRPPTGLFGYGYLPELDECEFNPVTINVKAAPVMEYVSTPNETYVNYVFGENKVIKITVDSDLLPSLDQCYVYAWVNGEGENNRYLINGVKGNKESFEFDLVKISDKLREGENTITFHVDSDFIEDLIWSSNYKFNPLTVNASFTKIEGPLYKTILSPNNIEEYTNGTSKIVTVTASYNQTKASSFGFRTMFIYINDKAIPISDIYANSTSFNVDLRDYSEYFVVGKNNISIHPQLLALEDVFKTNQTRFSLDTLFVNVIPRDEIKYYSNATVNGSNSVEYVINEHEDVLITVVCDLLDKFESYDKLYAWIGDNYKEINTMANEASATIDLKDLSDKFKFVEGQTYTIYFHPDIDDLRYINIKSGEYEFDPLTVKTVGIYVPEPTVVYASTPEVDGKSSIDYTIGEDIVVTVNVVYNDSYKENSGFKDKSMRIFINGNAGSIIGNVRANATSFTVNLADYITEEGDYHVSFGPENSVLSWVFYHVDNYVVELNNLTVSATLPEPDYLYTVTPNPVSIADYANESKVITVCVNYTSELVQNQLSAYSMYIYINGNKIKALDDVKSDSNSFTIDLADFIGYFVEGKTNKISIHPDVSDLDAAFANGNHALYKFTNLTVTLKDLTPAAVSSYNSTVVPSEVDYIVGQSLKVTVYVEYDDYFNDDLSDVSMFVYINGEDLDNRIKISGVNANDTCFEFDLKTISGNLVEGKNNLTFHPHPGALEGTFTGPYTFNTLVVNVKKSDEPAGETKTNYTTTPVPSEVDYIIGESLNVDVNVDYDSTFSNDLANIPVYVYINGGSAIDTGIKANVNSFNFDLNAISDKLTVGINDIAFGAVSDLIDVSVFNKLTVNATNALEPVAGTLNYKTTPSVSSVDYTIGDSFNVNVNIEYDGSYVAALANLPVYIYINDETAIEISGIKADDDAFEIDLKTIGDYLSLGKNTISVGPIKEDLTEIDSNATITYNTLIINAQNPPVNPNSTYVSTPTPSKVLYNLEESFVVTVTTTFDEYFKDDMEFYSMFVYINGEEMANRVKIEGVKANETTFTFDLKTISDRLVEGQNNLTFHPHPGALEGTVSGPYVFNKLTVIVQSNPDPIVPVEPTSYTGIIYVGANGKDTNDGSANNPVATIKKAIELASSENNTKHKIIVCEGTYVEHDLNITSALGIVGEGNVVVDAQQLGRIFNINTTGSVSINGIAFANGKADKGGAIDIVNAGDVTIKNNRFINNTANQGSAIYADSATLILEANAMSGGDERYIYINNAKINTDLTLTFYAPSKTFIGTPARLNATLVDDMGNYISGIEVTFKANGVEIGKAKLLDGISTVEFIPKEEIEYTISGSCDGNPRVLDTTLNPKLEDVSLIIGDASGMAGNDLVVPVTVKLNGENVNGDSVSVTFDNKTFDVPVVNGMANVSITLPDKAGIYDLTVSYMGEEQSKFIIANSKSGSVIAITAVDGNKLVGIVKDTDGNPIANAEVKFTIYGNIAFVNAKADGTFTIEIPYDSETKLMFGGDNNTLPYNTTVYITKPAVPTPVKVETRFNIPGNAITIKGYAVDTKAGEKGMRYSTQLLDSNGKPMSGAFVQFAVNNKIYNRTTYLNGSFNPYHLDMIRAGRYTMAFSFGGDDNHTSTFAVVCVDLDKKPITIKASAKTFKASTKTKKYTVTLKTIVGSSFDGKAHLRSGLNVKLTVNSKTYSGKINNKGKVTFKITNLSKKAKYIAKISYVGDITYESATKKVKITVK